ncbi:hypothetical protein EXD82_07905 [Peptacetobacter hominis]|uniref:Uncharacterized protein n=1 Tax=Peptacetobacter hominis TaxID=2743610 RepID=A0A544QU74_9FIRM|nr:hypothetical protein [Peptacetobacter hominis]TQQ84248.1 hypothetical protein EXD82_07905 [Peptacetobacter hominis]
MSKIRPVYAEFKLDENKVIDFRMLKSIKERVLKDTVEPVYGYAEDILYMDVYSASVDNMIKMPVLITPDIMTESDRIKMGQIISDIRGLCINWTNTIKPEIKAIPETVLSKSKDIEDTIDDINGYIDEIIDGIVDKDKAHIKKYVDRFNNKILDVKFKSSDIVKVFDDFFENIEEYGQDLSEDENKLGDLKKIISDSSENVKKIIEKNKKYIEELEGIREKQVGIAIGLGVTSGVVIIRSVAIGAVTGFLPFGIVVAVFAGGALAAGCAALAIEASKTLEKINAEKENLNDKEKDQTTLGLFINNIETSIKQYQNMNICIEDIKKYWKNVDSVIDNISDKAKELDKNEEEIDVDSEEYLNEWKNIKNDLSTIKEIAESLDEAVSSLGNEYKVVEGFDIPKDATADEIIKKFEEYYKSLDNKNIG